MSKNRQRKKLELVGVQDALIERPSYSLELIKRVRDKTHIGDAPPAIVGLMVGILVGFLIGLFVDLLGVLIKGTFFGVLFGVAFGISVLMLGVFIHYVRDGCPVGGPDVRYGDRMFAWITLWGVVLGVLSGNSAGDLACHGLAGDSLLGILIVGILFCLDRISRVFTTTSDRKSRTATRQRALRQSQALLNLAELILPRKITGECFGDCYEALEEMAETVPSWRLQLEALISIFWAVLFTLREVAKPGALIAAIWRLLFGGPLD